MILVIDNYDSFTYNLVQYLGQCGAEVVVKRNDQITVEEIQQLDPKGIVLSPGPCTPKESGICLDILQTYLQHGPISHIPLFGVCLGLQTMGYVGGGTVTQAKNIMHGKASMVTHDGKGLFEGLPNPLQAIRYHSLIVTKNTVPKGFIVTSTADDDGEVMGLRHQTLPIEGLQFHPESVLTQNGIKFIENFVQKTQP